MVLGHASTAWRKAVVAFAFVEGPNVEVVHAVLPIHVVQRATLAERDAQDAFTEWRQMGTPLKQPLTVSLGEAAKMAKVSEGQPLGSSSKHRVLLSVREIWKKG